MRINKKIIALALALGMSASLASCANTDYAMEINSTQVAAGEYILYQSIAIQEAQYHEDINWELEDFWANTIEDMPIEDWVNNRAIYMAKQVYATNMLYDELGLSLSEEDLAAIEYDMESWDEYSASYEALGVGESSYELQITNGVKSIDAFTQYYSEEGGIEPISDDDLLVYFEDEFTLYKYISFSKLNASTGEALSEEELEATQDRIQDYLEKIEENPEDFDDIFEEKLEEDARISDSEAPTFEDDAEYMQVAKSGEGDSFDSYYISQDVEAAIFADGKIGEPVVIEDENTDYIVLRYDINENPEYFDIMRESLLNDLKEDDFTAMLEERATELDVVLNDAAINRYSPKKLI